MKKLLILSAILSTVFAVDAQSLNKFPSLDGYDLVFSDEFDGTQLNKEVWKVEVTDNGGGNNELQYYVNDNVKVADGNLVITARRQRYGTKDFTSGRINSLGRAAFKHGIIQARIKLPKTANGLWPAFWLMGNDMNTNNWPNCGEIDVLEAGGSQGIKTGTQERFFISALHWGPYTNGQHPMYSCSTTADNSIQDDNFHLFTLVWDENKISMYLDDLPTPYFEMNITDKSQQNSPGNYFHKRFFLLFNLAVGGTMTDIFTPNDITALVYGERSMYVDYVRVYQKRYQKDYLIPGADVSGGEEPVITEDTVTQLGNYGSLSLDEDGNSTFDFENSSDFVVIGASKGVMDQMGDRIRANYSVDDVDNYLYIWEGTYDPRPTDGVNSFGLKETWNSYVVKSAGWSGLGYASSGSSKPGKDMSMLDEYGYILHFAMRGTDDLLHTNHAIGVGEASFTIGSAPFVDGNKILPVLGDFKRDGRWCSFDIPVSVLKNLGTPLYPQMDAVKDNVLYFLSGGNAGAELQFDNVFFYKNPNINTDLPTTDENTKIGKYAKPSLNADGESTFDFDDAYDYVVIGASNGVIDQMGQDNIVANYSVDDVNNYLYVWEETYEPRATEGVNSFGLEEKWNSYVVLNKGWSGLGYASTNAAGTAKGKDLSMLDDSYYLHFAMRGTDLIRHTSHTVGVGASQFIIGNTTNAAAMLGDFKRDGQWYSFDIPFSEILMSGGNPFTEDGGVNAYQGNVISFLSGGTPGVELQFDNIFFYKKHSDSGHTIDYDPELGRYGYKALDDEGNPVFDLDAHQDYVLISLGEEEAQLIKDKTIADYRVDDVNHFLYVWENTYNSETPSGVNSFGREEKYQALSVGSMGWSGLGFASTGGEGKGKDLSMLDDSYRLHIAFKGNDTEHVTHAIGVGSAHFSLGLKPFNDNGKLYGLMGDFKRDGEWYCFDIPFDEIAMRANPVFANGSNYIDNVISILSGGTAGVGLNFDAIFFYRDAKEQLMGDVNGDGVLDVKDVTGLINYILGTPPADFVLENANIDGEGEIDVQDVTALINMILD